jgi:nicotinamidase-related amidase
MASLTLRALTGMTPDPAPISKSALVLIDCQQTYREGIMQLVDVEPALEEAAALLKRFRDAGRPVIHIMHDAGPGTPYDTTVPLGQIADSVAPIEGETVIIKKFPSAFEQTALDAELKKLGVENVVYVGFMTHMCVNSTARAYRDAQHSQCGFRSRYAGGAAPGCESFGPRRHVRCRRSACD